MLKSILFCAMLLALCSMPAFAQSPLDTIPDRGTPFGYSTITYSLPNDSTLQRIKVSEENPLPVGLLTAGTSLDTTITVTTAPTKLSGFIDTLNVSFLYLYNNTSGATLYVGGSAGVLTSGVPVSYQGSFTDNIGFYDNTTDIWLVASASTNVRVKLKYR
jgi:hypothetical protein